jgi:hypothetical protein
MIETVTAQTGETPQEVIADNAYCSQWNLEYVSANGTDAYVVTDRLRLDAPVPAGRGPVPKNATLTDRTRRKARTKREVAAHRRRKSIVEPVFGQMKVILLAPRASADSPNVVSRNGAWHRSRLRVRRKWPIRGGDRLGTSQRAPYSGTTGAWTADGTTAAMSASGSVASPGARRSTPSAGGPS